MLKPNLISCFWDWVDNRSIISRIVLGVTVWMSWRAFLWASVFSDMVMHLPKGATGFDAATMIAAVTAPIAVLQGYVFKVYADGRMADKSTTK